MSKITLELTNNVAEVLYGILVSVLDDAVAELKVRRILNKDGTRKKSRKYFGEYDQHLLDRLQVAEALYKSLEPQLETFKEQP